MIADDLPIGSGPGESSPGPPAPIDVEQVAAELAAAFGVVYERVTEALRPIAAAFVGLAEQLIPIANAFMVLANDLAAVWRPELGAVYAVRRMGVTAADVRSCDGVEVRLWNHRRLPLPPDFGPWAHQAMMSGLAFQLANESGW